MTDAAPVDPLPLLAVVGASAGAVGALIEILPRLPASHVLPLVIVVHQPPTHLSLLAELFARKCKLPVLEARDKAPVASGHIYFAPPDYHLMIERDMTFVLSLDEPVNFSRPSIDVLLESAADSVGNKLLAIILTGTNADGARGLRAVRRAGGTGWVQVPESAQAPAMPRAAIDLAGADAVLTLAEIADGLQRVGRARSNQRTMVG
jgi:two-component system, chemotaxis family, protein-glutamate methylesterase/glutaminase